MDDEQLKEYLKQQVEKHRLRSIAELIYKVIREKYSPRETHRTTDCFIDLVNVYSESDIIRRYSDIIRRYIECLCISEYDPSDIYEYYTRNLYDPTFIDKFTYLPEGHLSLDLTEELFGDENRAALEKRK